MSIEAWARDRHPMRDVEKLINHMRDENESDDDILWAVRTAIDEAAPHAYVISPTAHITLLMGFVALAASVCMVGGVFDAAIVFTASMFLHFVVSVAIEGHK